MSIRSAAVLALLSLATAGRAEETFSVVVVSRSGPKLQQYIYHGVALGANDRDTRVTVPGRLAPVELGEITHIVLTRRPYGIVADVSLVASRIAGFDHGQPTLERSMLTISGSGPKAALGEEDQDSAITVVVLPERPAVPGM